MQLSEHFTLAELTTTSRAEFAAQQAAGAADLAARSALESLCRLLLEPLRGHVGGPVRITSGYRCPALNAATPGASATSQHCRGEAADFRPAGYSDADLRELWRWVGWSSGLSWGQLILEDRHPEAEGGAWIHVSLGAPWRPASACGQRLTWTPNAGYRRWSIPPA